MSDYISQTIIVTPGGGVSLGLGQISATHPPTQPPPRGGRGSMPSTRSHIQALENLWNNRAKLTSKRLPPLGLEPSTLKNRVKHHSQLN